MSNGQDYWAAQALAAAQALQGWYSPSAGLYVSGATTYWWNSAECLHALTGYMQATGDQQFTPTLMNTLANAQARHPGFINNFYDDCAWWGIAWAQARRLAGHNLTGDSYWNMAHSIFLHEVNGWDSVCGGGMWWSTAKTYKNAITTELLITLAAQLHLLTPGDTTLLAWAQKAASWLLGSGMIGASGMINDGLNASCANNGGTCWTYNQGVILSGLAALHEITGDSAYHGVAATIANAALAHLAPGGILADPCEPAGTCGNDGPQFKGAFIRGLRDLYAQDGNAAYRDFIVAQATSLWANARNTTNQVGLKWAGPFDSADPARQSSALHALNAATSMYSTTDA